MKNDLLELSNILDEHIEKGEALTVKDRFKKISKIDQYEEVLQKGLTFDPFNPVSMTEDSPYYNPYQAHPMGGFYPHPSESWTSQGGQGYARTSAGYAENDEFYRVAGDGQMDEKYYNREKVVAQASRSQFARFSKSIDNLFKGGVPVGTTHQYADGQTYKKIAEGRWSPVAGLEKDATRRQLSHTDPKVQARANQHLENHAAQKMEIQRLMKQRTREDEVVGRAKNEAVQAAASHTKEMMGKLYDGKVPKDVEAAHQKVMSDHGAEKKDPKEMLQKEGEGLKPKTHHVQVRFNHQGKEYSHKFENVHGATHQEAISRVQEILKQKLPGHQLTGVRAETPKEMGKEPSRQREARA